MASARPHRQKATRRTLFSPSFLNTKFFFFYFQLIPPSLMAKNEKDEKVARFIWSSWAKFAQSGEPGQGWPPFNNEEVVEAKRSSLHANALPPSPQHSRLKGTNSQKNYHYTISKSHLHFVRYQLWII